MTTAPRIVGRYLLLDRIASGGMASVHVGRLVGPAGFKRTVAIKRMHERFVLDPAFIAMFMEEARLAARVSHPNVVPTFDVVLEGEELLLVMEHVHGRSLSRLLAAAANRGERPPPAVMVSVVVGMLAGLHAAHEAKGDDGARLEIVHRDVSPQNILVGLDGVPRLVDFGIAKAATSAQTTRADHVKGKAGYMAPEQLRQERVDRRTDVYAAGVVLWEALTGARLYSGGPAAIVAAVLEGAPRRPSTVVDVPAELEAIVMRALAHDRGERFATAREMADALEALGLHATTRQVGSWVEEVAGESLATEAKALAAIAAPPGAGPDDATAIGEAPTAALRESAPAALARETRHRVPVAAFAAGLVSVGVVSLIVTSAQLGAAPAAAPSGSAARPRSSARTATSGPAPSAVVAAPDATPEALADSRSSADSGETAARPTARPTPRSTPKGASQCDPDFVLDEMGVKHFKPECM